MDDKPEKKTLFEAAVGLFGFRVVKDKDDDVMGYQTFAPPVNELGAVDVEAGGYNQTYVDMDGGVRTEAELVNKYRDMAACSELDQAVDDIVNEIIVSEDDQEIIEIQTDKLKDAGYDEPVQKLIRDEFAEVLRLLDFEQEAYNLARKWYVDGRIYFHASIDPKAPKDGIKQLRQIDPRKIRLIRETGKRRALPGGQPAELEKIIGEYYVYNEKGFGSTVAPKNGISGSTTAVLKIAKDSVVHVTSGMLDKSGRHVISHLHKALKPLNMLRAMEDATLIYRISRAPERRVFYIDVGNLPKAKAEQYVASLMNKFKNKLTYNPETGMMRDDRKFTTMIEDYWLPRKEGGKSTEIDTLPAGQNLGELEDVKYFQRLLYRSLNVPFSRMDNETAFAWGKMSEITRDEIKFAKFIYRLRLQMAKLFLAILQKNLLLKGLITADDWDRIESLIKFRWARDNHFAEAKDAEIMMNRIEIGQALLLFAGKYYSHDWIRRNVFRQDDELIERMDAEIKGELNNQQFVFQPPEMAPGEEEVMPPDPGGPDIGAIPQSTKGSPQ